ncbi:hypothetical protein DXG01_006883 [Tephrocybe rancida]|nr:hypothetical protein DXG01_006883 [Tephrocybe rancida]
MTRITNFGRKRTYLEATSSSNLQDDPLAPAEDVSSNGPAAEIDGDTAPPKKKRKRTKLSMRDGNTGVKAAEAALEREKKILEAEARAASGESPAPLTKSAKKRLRESGKKVKSLQESAPALSASEWRRQKRIDEKFKATTCYACRQRGHAAKDCPNAEKLPSEDGQKAHLVGICYRCGSTKHTLSRCKKPVDQSDPLPFASCFVCNGKGHLASSCPQNKAKGVYPDGGCCKLCGDTSHLARDCGLRKRDVVETTTILGTGTAAGADEDDFHSFKRQKTEVNRIVEREERQSGNRSMTKSGGSELPVKKVVYF